MRCALRTRRVMGAYLFFFVTTLIHTGMLHTTTPFVMVCPVTKELTPLLLCYLSLLRVFVMTVYAATSAEQCRYNNVKPSTTTPLQSHTKIHIQRAKLLIPKRQPKPYQHHKTVRYIMPCREAFVYERDKISRFCAAPLKQKLS